MICIFRFPSILQGLTVYGNMTFQNMLITGNYPLVYQEASSSLQTFTLYNVTGYNYAGGLLSLDGMVAPTTFLNVTHSKFTNMSGGSSGSFYTSLFSVWNGKASITYSTFNGIYSLNGNTGALLRIVGAADIAMDSCTVNDCVVSGNFACINNQQQGNTVITNSVFTNVISISSNGASSIGGAVLTNTIGNVTLQNVTFSNSTTTGGLNSVPGGVLGIGTGNLFATDVSFSDSNSDTYGGAISLQYGIATLNRVTFNRSRAWFGNGGAIWLTQGAIIGNNVVADNSYASNQGGAFYVQVHTGAVEYGASTFTNLIVYNASAQYGGAYYAMDAWAVFNNASFTYCQEFAGSGGAALMAGSSGNMTLNYTSFRNSVTALNTISMYLGGDIFVYNSNFYNEPFVFCTAQIYVHSGNAVLQFTNFWYPCVTMSVVSGNANLTNVNIYNPYSELEGTLAFADGTMSLVNCFISNASTAINPSFTNTFGGVIYGGPQYPVSLVLDNVTFQGGDALGNAGLGGIIYMESTQFVTISISNSIFIGGKSASGAVIGTAGGGAGNTINITNSNFTDCLANSGDASSSGGGGILGFYGGDYAVTINGCNFNNIYATVPSSSNTNLLKGAIALEGLSSNTFNIKNSVINNSMTYYIGQNLATSTYLFPSLTVDNLPSCVYSDLFSVSSPSHLTLSGVTFYNISAPCLYTNYSKCLQSYTTCTYNTSTQSFVGSGVALPPQSPPPAPSSQTPQGQTPSQAPQGQTPQGQTPQGQTPQAATPTSAASLRFPALLPLIVAFIITVFLH